MNPSLSIYLDAVRLAAAAFVLFGHAFNFTGGYFRGLAGHGAASVAIFFVLSGFVIAFVTDKKERSGRSYAISRASRMYSVALGALAITVCADWLGYRMDPTPYLGYQLGHDGSAHLNTSYFNPDWTWLDLLRMVTFTNELWQSHIQVGSNEPYWSLGFEVWYYIIFGVYMFAPGGPKARLALAGLAALIAGPKICLYLPLWLLGVACYRFLRDSERRLSTTPTAWAALAFCATGVLYLLARKYSAPLTQSMFLPVGWDQRTAMTVLHFHFIGLLFCVNLISFVVLANRLTWISVAAQRAKRKIQWLAGATFTLYLAHQPLLLMSLAINPLERGTTEWAYTSMAATIVAVFALAEVTERKKEFWKRCFESMFKSS
ncbi:MAG: acyltransferase family protein [Aquabacterium sp.]